MRDQFQHLTEAAESPNADIRILPLNQHSGLVAGTFVIMWFGFQGTPGGSPDDVAGAEGPAAENYVEGKTGTQLYSLFSDSLQSAALSSADSRKMIMLAIARVW